MESTKQDKGNKTEEKLSQIDRSSAFQGGKKVPHSAFVFHVHRLGSNYSHKYGQNQGVNYGKSIKDI